MLPSWAARTGAVCILLFGMTARAAERRPVAVIELSESPRGAQVARELGNALNNHEVLKPVDNPELPGELMGPIADEDATRLADVRAKKQSADADLRRGDFARAATTAEAAQESLRFAAPSDTVVALYAELAFIVGNARLGERNTKDAEVAFRLAHSLDPAFRPNAALTFPEVLDAFDKAIATTPPNGTIAVSEKPAMSVAGTIRVILDGKEVGEPKWYPVPAGAHVVWLVGPERDPRAKQVVVLPERKSDGDVDAAPTSAAAKVRRARLALKVAPDPAARAAAMQQLAGVLGVHDAVLLTGVNGKLVVQTWRDRAPGFSALRELKDGEKSAELLEPLAPTPKKVPKEPKKADPIKIPVVEKHWYQKPRFWVGGGTLLTAIIVGSVMAYQSWDRHIGIDPDWGF